MKLSRTQTIIIALTGASISAFLLDQILRAKRAQPWVERCERVFGALKEEQKQTIQRIVSAFKKYGDGDPYKLAYILSTVDTECSFESKEEYYGSSNAHKTYWATGYHGRGLVQLTWKRNYQKMSDLLGVDFVNHPDKVMLPQYAARILVQGMMEGRFTRRKLSEFINPEVADFYNARKVVNGLDKAAKIALDAKALLN
ncbi:MAG: glycoside hydrolase family 19 protein [Aureispira sp.]